MTQFIKADIYDIIKNWLTSNICSISARLFACFREFKNSFALMRNCAEIIFDKFCCTAAIFVLKRICQTKGRLTTSRKQKKDAFIKL